MHGLFTGTCRPPGHTPVLLIVVSALASSPGPSLRVGRAWTMAVYHVWVYHAHAWLLNLNWTYLHSQQDHYERGRSVYHVILAKKQDYVRAHACGAQLQRSRKVSAVDREETDAHPVDVLACGNKYDATFCIRFYRLRKTRLRISLICWWVWYCLRTYWRIEA